MLFSRSTLKPDAIGVIVVATLSAVAVAVVVGPSVLAGAPTHQMQAAVLEQRQRLAKSLHRELGAYTKHLTELRSEAQLSVQLIPPNHVNQRLGETSQVAASCGVAITQMGHSEARPAEARSLLVPIKLSGTASYPDITRFVHTLHERFRDTAVRSLRITAPPISVSPTDPSQPAAAPAAAQATFALDLDWYCAPADSAASAGSAGAPSRP